jgi:hypothetical protein
MKTNDTPSQPAPAKKPYHRPELQRYGTVKLLTRGGGMSGNQDTGTMGASTRTY